MILRATITRSNPRPRSWNTHVHFRPFGGAGIPFEEPVSYLKEPGVLFSNRYGIGQTLPPESSCTDYLDCLGTPVAANYSTNASAGVHWTLARTFPDLSQPESIGGLGGRVPGVARRRCGPRVGQSA